MIILVGGTKGGGGKTTTAVNLAIQLSILENSPEAVFMLDADIQGSALNWIGTRMTNQLKPEVKCAKRNTSESTKDLLQSIKDLDKTYKYVIIDSGGYDGPSFRAALTVSHLLVFPIQPTQLDIWEVDKTNELIELARGYNPDLKVLTVLSRCSTLKRSTDADGARAAIEDKGLSVAKTTIGNRVSYQRCASDGLGVVEYNDAKSKQEIIELTQEIINVIQTD